jgi:hypothetical protein
VVADVVAYLLETAERREVADGVREYGVAFEGQTGSEAGHVLLRDTNIQELTREASDEVVQDAKAEITCKE